MAMLQKFQKLKLNSDILGISSSVLCLLHCLALPIFYLFVTKSAQELEWLHELDFIFIGLGFIAVYQTTKNTVNRWIPFFLWFFFGLFAISILNEHSLMMELLSYGGSAGLITTHYFNFSLSH